MWNPATGRLLGTLRDPGGQAAADAVAFSPDSKTVATGDGDGSTYLWNTATRTRIATLPGSPAGVGGGGVQPRWHAPRDR